MTPLHIKIMLHYYCRVQPYAENEPAHRYSSAVKEYHVQLLDMAMIETSEININTYRITEKGKAYVEALKAVKEPVQKISWIQP